MPDLSQPLLEQERKRHQEGERADAAVEANHGPRPLEGFAAGHTTWTPTQDDEAAREVFGDDEKSQAATPAPGARST